MNIYVGNLDFKVSEDELTQLFSEYGQVESSKIIIDKYNGISKGFGFVIMNNETEANAAVEGLNNFEFKNREISVNEARPRKESYNR